MQKEQFSNSIDCVYLLTREWAMVLEPGPCRPTRGRHGNSFPKLFIEFPKVVKISCDQAADCS